MFQWCKIFQRAEVIVIICMCVNNLIQIDKFIFYFENIFWMGHPYFETLITGGVNLEATWIAILAVSFINTKFKWLVLLVSFSISALYASRVGIIANFICMFIFTFYKADKIDLKKYMYKIIMFIFLGIIILIILTSMGFLNRVLERFLNIGKDPGSLGRLNMWRHIPQTLISYPFGVGIGNVMRALEKVSGVTFVENNIHNLPLQMFCELGWIGGVFYILLILTFVKKELKNLFKNPMCGMLFIYLFLSILQLRGGETIYFIILGAYLCTTNEKVF